MTDSLSNQFDRIIATACLSTSFGGSRLLVSISPIKGFYVHIRMIASSKRVIFIYSQIIFNNYEIFEKKTYIKK